jgi:hypothetical protein
MVSFYLFEHFLENSEKLTEASGCFFLYYSQQICTNPAYDDILPLNFLGSPLTILVFFPQQDTESPSAHPALTCPVHLYGAQCSAVAVRAGVNAAFSFSPLCHIP